LVPGAAELPPVPVGVDEMPPAAPRLVRRREKSGRDDFDVEKTEVILEISVGLDTTSLLTVMETEPERSKSSDYS